MDSERVSASTTRLSVFGNRNYNPYHFTAIDYVSRFNFLLENSENAPKQINLRLVRSPRHLALRPRDDVGQCEQYWWRLFPPRWLALCFGWNLYVSSFHIHHVNLRWNSGRPFAYQCPFALDISVVWARETNMTISFRRGTWVHLQLLANSRLVGLSDIENRTGFHFPKSAVHSIGRCNTI